jgi:hypothetical protein
MDADERRIRALYFSGMYTWSVYDNMATFAWELCQVETYWRYKRQEQIEHFMSYLVALSLQFKQYNSVHNNYTSCKSHEFLIWNVS